MQIIDNQQLKYFLYVRRSQDAEDRQVASLDDQMTEMKQRAEALGIVLVDVLGESKSAKSPGRPVFNDMIRRIQAGEADGILCWKLNRLSRNPVDCGTIQWLLQQGVVKCVQTYDRYYLPTDNVIAMGVEMLQAIQFVNDLSVDVKRGMRNKARRQWNPQSCLPAGYVHNTGYKEGQDEIVSTTDLLIMKKLFTCYLEGGYTIPAIAKKAKTLGLRSPKSGEPYCTNSIANLLRNPMYMGKFDWMNEDGIREIKPGKHEAIISESEFRRMQLLMGKQGRNTRPKKYDFPFRGPFTCGDCGYNITAEHKLQCICTGCKKKFSCKSVTACTKCGLEIEDMDNPSFVDITYYPCSQRGKKTGCTQKGGIKESELAAAISEALQDLEIDKDYYQWCKAALKVVHAAEVKQHHEAHSRISKRKGELIEQADALVAMRAAKEINAERFQVAQAKIDNELGEIDSASEQVSERVKHWVEITDGYLTFAESAVQVFNETTDIELKKELIQTLGSNLTIKDKKAFITLLEPMVKLQEVRAGVESKLGKFEPKKALVKQGPFKQKHAAFESLCAGQDSNLCRNTPGGLQPPAFDRSATDACILL